MPLGGVAVPRPYFVAADDMTARVVLLLEDLSAARAGDAQQDCASDDAELVVQAMARFHARWWKHPNLTSFTWLPQWDSDHGARQERYRQQVGPFLERFGQRIPASIRDVIERLPDGFGAVLSALDSAPATLIHADLHLDNVLFNLPGAEPPTVLLDWQSVCRGPCVMDFAPFACGSLAATDDLFHRYHALLVAGGVSGYTLDDLRVHARLALLRHLAGIVGWLSSVDLDSLTGRERALALAALEDRRFMAAQLDHDVAALLPR